VLCRIARLSEHDDVIKPLLRGALRLGLALGPAPARAGPVSEIAVDRGVFRVLRGLLPLDSPQR